MNYDSKDLEKYLDTLLTFSAILFTILGVMVTFVYPETIKNKGDKLDAKEDALLNGIISCASICVIILVYYYLKIFLSMITWNDTVRFVFKGLMLGWFGSLGVFLIISLLKIFFSFRANR
ncbi:hypothetical protein [Carnimonas nigrificans]|uniref:hypothetical protein n=1 Tax=Carnimonas nigrificans TaxID=64323 RepID=UPI000470DA69|nr:hypothetical protein [Carnimonas nigrificans]